MDIVIYLQCDMRYNNYLMRTIQAKRVIEHAIDRIKSFYR